MGIKSEILKVDAENKDWSFDSLLLQEYKAAKIKNHVISDFCMNLKLICFKQSYIKISINFTIKIITIINHNEQFRFVSRRKIPTHYFSIFIKFGVHIWVCMPEINSGINIKTFGINSYMEQLKSP